MSTGLASAVILSHGDGGLGAARSLGRRGVEVTVIAYDEDDPVLYSHYPTLKIRIKGADDETREQFVLEELDNLRLSGAALLATSDRLAALISNHRAELSDKYRFVLPSAQLIDALNDKSQEVELLESLGFDIPKTTTRLPGDPDALAGQLRFPMIFKPHSYAVQHLFPEKNEIIADAHELELFYKRWRNALPALLAQEVLTGPDSLSWICSCSFDQQHRMLDCGIKQKIRSLPAHFGGSTLAVSRKNEQIEQLAAEVGAKLNYVGHAGLEFRWDRRDDCFRFIELNPRFPANVGFDEACGLPTAWNSYQVSLGKNPTPSGTTQRQGVYFLDWTGDLSSQAADGTSIFKIVASYLPLLFRRTSGLYFEWSDPVPGLVVGYRFIARALAKLVNRI